MSHVLALLLALLIALPLHAQSAELVPLDARVYRDIDVLGAAGVLDSLIVGQRPYTRREVGRLLREARAILRARGDTASRVWDVVTDDLAMVETPVRWLATARVEASAVHDIARQVPPDPNGSTDARVDPLLAYREGRWYPADGSIAAEALDRWTPAQAFSAWVQPRVVLASQGGAHAEWHGFGIDALLGNLSVSVGRQPIVFGQVPTGGITLSRNARPLDAIRIANDRPYTLPWLLRFLGPLRGTAFIADLGPNQRFPHSRLIEYKLSGAILPWFEFGSTVQDETGGRGAPPASFLDRIQDAYPLFDILRTKSEYQFSNKMAGFDARLRFPRAAGLEVFFEGAVDDFDVRRWVASIAEDGGWVTGASASCFLGCGRVVARLEYHQTGIRYYTHTQFASGIEQNGFFLGDALGPRARGGYLTLDGGSIVVRSAFEVIGGNKYGSASNGPNDEDFHFVLLERHPFEKRARLAATIRPAWFAHGMRPFVTAGVERVWNFDFVAGATRENAVLQVGLEPWR